MSVIGLLWLADVSLAQQKIFLMPMLITQWPNSPDLNRLAIPQLMAMVTWAKKSSSKSANIGSKVHIVATWETIKELKSSTPLGDSSWHALPNLPKLADFLA